MNNMMDDLNKLSDEIKDNNTVVKTLKVTMGGRTAVVTEMKDGRMIMDGQEIAASRNHFDQMLDPSATVEEVK